MIEERPLGVPPLGKVTWQMITEALRRGAGDMRRAPGYAVVFASVYVFFGWAMVWITWVSGQSYWLVLAATGFPLIGPFAAVGLYEVSHRLEEGNALDAGEIFGVIATQRHRQLPWICAIIVIMLLFWFFVAHMIFALFLGFSTMTNISSSLDVYFTAQGLSMLAFGTLVGALFALVLFMITVISLPLLLDREVDFVTAMLTSIQSVSNNPGPMLAWGALVAGLTFLAFVPAFLGLYVVLPLLGHATWHLYRQAVEAGAQEAGVELNEPAQQA
ncbi:MAG: DUF2189 domain-containing protein [Pseudomonadota bacterium]